MSLAQEDDVEVVIVDDLIFNIENEILKVKESNN